MVLAALVAVSIACVTAAAGLAAEGGNSENAHLCQSGGWQEWVQADRSPFANQGDCVSYGAQGGTLTPVASAAQLLCESFGGVYGGPEPPTVWTCTYQFTGARSFALFLQCASDAGIGSSTFGWVAGDPAGLRTDACTRT